jgi:site-specific recombinase XerD
VTGDRLTTGGVRDLLSRRAVGAGIEDEIRPHDLRRTVAGELLDAGTDLAMVARLLGHANVSTTARYDRRPESAVASAVPKLRFPYRRN